MPRQQDVIPICRYFGNGEGKRVCKKCGKAVPLRRMRSSVIFSLLIFLADIPSAAAEDTSAGDSIHCVATIPEVEISATYKGSPLDELRPVARTTLRLREVERLRIHDVKGLSILTPGLFIPDYGARMTASLYVRGLGSRIDQPAMGMYVDGIPILNKNDFDADLADIRAIDVLRGPQSTLYGRNAMGGVIDIRTLSPLAYEGTRLAVEYGNGQTARARIGIYRRAGRDAGWSVAAHGSHSDGFHTNATTGDHCDWSNTAGLTARYEHAAAGGTYWGNTATVNWVNQGGFPYRQIHPEDGTLDPIATGSRCAYHRLSLRDGLSVSGAMGGSGLAFHSATAAQWLDDGMTMDQDFTRADIFTLEQKQREFSLNEDFTLRPATTRDRWDWLAGINIWGRDLTTEAPVGIREEGVSSLILTPANRGLQSVFPAAELSFAEPTLDIPSDFHLRSYGAALYLHVTLRTGAWTWTAGLRTEHEGQHFRYDSRAAVSYRVTPFMTEAQPLPVRLRGTENLDFTEWSPSVAATFRHDAWTAHATVARGYKAGGFNTQLFSDLVQQALSSRLQESLGLAAADGGLALRDVITYKPEYAWNFEAGLRYVRGAWEAEATAFHIDCRDQQLTVFPAGTRTGRMMTNAGRTESHGIEASLARRGTHLDLRAAYGWTHATFRRYDDGTRSYKGCHMPYAPEHTLTLAADGRHSFPSGGGWTIEAHADWQAAGPIHWDDANTLRQDFYGLLAASVSLRHGAYGLTLWGRNLTDESYRTFYFVSMQRHFLQEGKPRTYGLTLTAEF